MGAAESKVAAQPLAVVTAAAPARAPQGRSSVTGWPCNLLRKQNKTAPAIPATPSATNANQPTPPRSTPTMEANKQAKELTTTTATSLSSSGPNAQILAANKTVNLQQLSFEELSTHLLKAVKNGDQRLVERIVEIAVTKNWAIINIRGMWESTPLIYACQYCHEPIALWLLRQGADVHLVNEKGVSALLLASLEGMTTAAHEILTRHSNEATTQNQEGPLHIDTHVGVVYNSVADVNVRANPLLAASMNGHEAVVKLLLAHGANANQSVAPLSSGGNKSAPSGSGSGGGGRGVLQFPLLASAKYGHATVAKMLIEHGADIGEMDGNENHALLLACEAAREDCALALLELLHTSPLSADDHAAWKRANAHGFTPLHYCGVHGLLKVANFMLHDLRWGQDLDFVNATSSTRQESAVLMAARKKQVEVVALLLQNGADPLLADRGATTAIDVLKRDKRDDLVALWEGLRPQKEIEVASKETRQVTSPRSHNESGEKCELVAEPTKVATPLIPETTQETIEKPTRPEHSQHTDETRTSPIHVQNVTENTRSNGEPPLPAQTGKPWTAKESQSSQDRSVSPEAVTSSPCQQPTADDDPAAKSEKTAAETFENGSRDEISTSSPKEDTLSVVDIYPQPSYEQQKVTVSSDKGACESVDAPVEVVDGFVASAVENRVPDVDTIDHPTPQLEGSVAADDKFTTVGSVALDDESAGMTNLAPPEEVPDLVPMVPTKPRSKSTTGHKVHSRRATGFAVDAKAKAKSASSIDALVTTPIEADGEDDQEDGGSSIVPKREHPQRESERDDEVADVDTQSTEELTSKDVAPTSPKKHGGKQKKKKRHSKKKPEESASSPPIETMNTTPDDEPSAPSSSLCIHESKGAEELDDDF